MLEREREGYSILLVFEACCIFSITLYTKISSPVPQNLFVFSASSNHLPPSIQRNPRANKWSSKIKSSKHVTSFCLFKLLYLETTLLNWSYTIENCYHFMWILVWSAGLLELRIHFRVWIYILTFCLISTFCLVLLYCSSTFYIFPKSHIPSSSFPWKIQTLLLEPFTLPQNHTYPQVKFLERFKLCCQIDQRKIEECKAQQHFNQSNPNFLN